ncbi:MAG: ferredoxin [Gemmatimonadetes bacterium]|nr:ferredoxin [Gemmatimonadota bacterium]
MAFDTDLAGSPVGGASEDRRSVGDLLICIDRAICVGFEDCITAAPGAFRLDAEGIATFSEPEGIERDRLLAACAACPVDALSVLDAAGRRILP